MNPHAAFLVARPDVGDFQNTDYIFLCATTRPDGGIGLPGGKVEKGEDPTDAVLREAKEEGWAIPWVHQYPIYVAEVDGKIVHWYLSNAVATRLLEYKESGRIFPLLATIKEIGNSGNGNEFLLSYNFFDFFSWC